LHNVSKLRIRAVTGSLYIEPLPRTFPPEVQG